MKTNKIIIVLLSLLIFSTMIGAAYVTSQEQGIGPWIKNTISSLTSASITSPISQDVLITVSPASSGFVRIYKNGVYMDLVTSKEHFAFITSDKIGIYPQAAIGYKFDKMCDLIECISTSYTGGLYQLPAYDVVVYFVKDTVPTPTPIPTSPTNPSPTYTPTPTSNPTPVSSSTGTLSISSVPTGASISVDGLTMGVTNTNLILNTGSHIIRLTLNGYAPESSSINIISGKTITFETALDTIVSTPSPTPTLTPTATPTSYSTYPAPTPTPLPGTGTGTESNMYMYIFVAFVAVMIFIWKKK